MIHKRKVIIVSDSASTMTVDDMARIDRMMSNSASPGSVFRISATTLVPEPLAIIRKTKRDKDYWKPRFERERRR